jgi:hypothetical protein
MHRLPLALALPLIASGCGRVTGSSELARVETTALTLAAEPAPTGRPPAVEPAPPPVSPSASAPKPPIRVLVGGDLIPHRPSLASPASVAAALEPLADLFGRADSVVANYEAATASSRRRPSGSPTRHPPSG